MADRAKKIQGLMEKYGVKTTPSPKPRKEKKEKKKSLREWVQELLGLGKKGTYVPSGIRTPKQIKEFKEIMELDKKKKAK